VTIVIVLMARVVRILQRHRNRFHLRLAEILEEEFFGAAVTLESFVEIAAPALRAELARSQDEDLVTNHFHAFHEAISRNRNGLGAGPKRLIF
jgi:hypothetical protein